MELKQQKKCRPCEGGTFPLSPAEARLLLKQFAGWTLSENGKEISRKYVMKGFSEAVNLINQIRDIAEAEDHHPDVHLTGYRHLEIRLSTHSIEGLSQNDFVLAAKIERLPKALKSPNP